MRSRLPTLVERSVAERLIPGVLRPAAAYHAGQSGFADLSLLSRGAGSRRLSSKRRAAILSRDGGRCRICERDPRDFEDMELEIHHIRPWSKGGTSDPANLIALCRRCHKNLKPHFDWTLFDLVDQRNWIGQLKAWSRQVFPENP